MATAFRVALRPKNEAPRRSFGETVRGTADFISSNNVGDSTTAHRIQFLVARYGLIGSHAAVLASIAWGAHHG
ncbi:hypothetical protein [Sphingomonas oligoaromativorans]|uniref:hypothetical protein n=1 Tax=Sphingomonas oligoaromativorans TaxID=575322 RepID=UPI001420F985|nr:hypothetical protein [Sphingomonas oligoaromativorans]NIJ32789.1 hypothetical protein [Sphingomonas oligoaromativorans]